MKKIFFLLFSAAILFSCNQNGNKTKINEPANHAVADVPLSLNNGAKWKADSTTNRNVINLKTIADNFRIKPFPSIDDYQLLGNDLNAGLNKMIKECKMSGADHDELHRWLEPVLKESNQLKTMTDTAVARTTFRSIDSRIDAYHNFFE